MNKKGVVVDVTKRRSSTLRLCHIHIYAKQTAPLIIIIIIIIILIISIIIIIIIIIIIS